MHSRQKNIFSLQSFFAQTFMMSFLWIGHIMLMRETYSEDLLGAVDFAEFTLEVVVFTGVVACIDLGLELE